jgi:ElaB/YqjD/DUF883 family membrane-anchored ribosome-binding protein
MVQPRLRPSGGPIGASDTRTVPGRCHPGGDGRERHRDERPRAVTAPAAKDPEAIQAEIEATREQLGRTIEQLSARLDVPARAKESAARARDTAVETYRESPPVVIGVAVALVGLIVGLVVLRRKRATEKRGTGRKR